MLVSQVFSPKCGINADSSSKRVHTIKKDLEYRVYKTEQKDRSNFLDKEMLVKLKLRAMRAGVWFHGLPRIDRVLVDLTIKVADCVRSPHLARCLLAVAGKLEELLESKLGRAVREFGLSIASKLSVLAQSWGNKTAFGWASDKSFARYWAVMKLNGHNG